MALNDWFGSPALLLCRMRDPSRAGCGLQVACRMVGRGCLRHVGTSRLLRSRWEKWQSPGEVRYFLFFQRIFGQNWFHSLRGPQLIILDWSGPPPTSPDPSCIDFTYLTFFHNFALTSMCMKPPCFLFSEGIKPQELFFRIKRHELVWKAARMDYVSPIQF